MLFRCESNVLKGRKHRLLVKIMFLFYPSRLHFISKRWNIVCYGEICVLFAFTSLGMCVAF